MSSVFTYTTEAQVILEMIAEEDDRKEGEEATTEQSESDESEDEITAELSESDLTTEQEDESSVSAKSPSVENEDHSTPTSEASDSIEEDEDSEDSEETNDNVKFHFLDRQYTCEEHPGDVPVCRVCIGVYGHVTEDMTVNVTTVGASAEGKL